MGDTEDAWAATIVRIIGRNSGVTRRFKFTLSFTLLSRPTTNSVDAHQPTPAAVQVEFP